MKRLLGILLGMVIAALPAPAGANVYVSTDVPKAIPDVSTVNSTLNVPDVLFPTDVNVTINLTHTFDSDLDISLIAPNLVSIDLTSDNGGAGDNFTNTIFNDGAATAITAGSAPFTGSFRPEQPLSTFNGINASGVWTLRIVDDLGGGCRKSDQLVARDRGRNDKGTGAGDARAARGGARGPALCAAAPQRVVALANTIGSGQAPAHSRRLSCFMARRSPYSALKYFAAGWWNTTAETDASGSIMNPSVSCTPICSGFSSRHSVA